MIYVPRKRRQRGEKDEGHGRVGGEEASFCNERSVRQIFGQKAKLHGILRPFPNQFICAVWICAMHPGS